MSAPLKEYAVVEKIVTVDTVDRVYTSGMNAFSVDILPAT